jgi:hypothetical protein
MFLSYSSSRSMSNDLEKKHEYHFMHSFFIFWMTIFKHKDLEIHSKENFQYFLLWISMTENIIHFQNPNSEKETQSKIHWKRIALGSLWKESQTEIYQKNPQNHFTSIAKMNLIEKPFYIKKSGSICSIVIEVSANGHYNESNHRVSLKIELMSSTFPVFI